jgi:hypothetical protein
VGERSAAPQNKISHPAAPSASPASVRFSLPRSHYPQPARPSSSSSNHNDQQENDDAGHNNTHPFFTSPILIVPATASSWSSRPCVVWLRAIRASLHTTRSGRLLMTDKRLTRLTLTTEISYCGPQQTRPDCFVVIIRGVDRSPSCKRNHQPNGPYSIFTILLFHGNETHFFGATSLYANKTSLSARGAHQHETTFSFSLSLSLFTSQPVLVFPSPLHSYRATHGAAS